MAAHVVVTIELTGIAHGGTCVGRFEGIVVFVRGGVPGETVRVAVDEQTKRFWRGRVVEVIEASPHRVTPSCPIVGECGGCDFQHIDLAHQRVLKAHVVQEQLRRLTQIDTDVTVAPLDADGFGWRTAMRYHASPDGSGLRAWRSHDVVPLPSQGCLLAHPSGRDLPLRGTVSLVRVAGSGLAVDNVPATVTEQVLGRAFAVASDGFWQVHPAAAPTLVAAVLAASQIRAGDRVLDLYCGVGLFASFLANAGGQVEGVEGNRVAVGHAKHNVPDARFSCADVARHRFGRADVVVLDPPRAGAGEAVVRKVAQACPRRVVYVSCDPATLARDLRTFDALGYSLARVQAFDAFPNTHHVECVATLVAQDVKEGKPDA